MFPSIETWVASSTPIIGGIVTQVGGGMFLIITGVLALAAALLLVAFGWAYMRRKARA